MKDNEIVLGFSKLDKTLIILVPIVLGSLIGWFVPVIADWLLTLPIVPMEKLIELIASFNSLGVSIIAAIIGIIISILLTLVILSESLEMTVSYNSLATEIR